MIKTIRTSPYDRSRVRPDRGKGIPSRRLAQKVEKGGGQSSLVAIVRSRAPRVRHVAQKLRIAMTQADGTGDWVDRRFDLMLASILLDLETGGLD